MEIRNALQKIDNYLNVVANLNKTILLEGTMSKDELLLMKKYLYTSIDRIEDIEKLLFIEQHDNKSFVPSEVEELSNKMVSPQKEIVEVKETDHVEEVEAVLTNEQKNEMEEMVEAIKSANENVVAENIIDEFENTEIENKQIYEQTETIALEEETVNAETQIEKIETQSAVTEITNSEVEIPIATLDGSTDTTSTTEIVEHPTVATIQNHLINDVTENTTITTDNHTTETVHIINELIAETATEKNNENKLVADDVENEKVEDIISFENTNVSENIKNVETEKNEVAEVVNTTTDLPNEEKIIVNKITEAEDLHIATEKNNLVAEIQQEKIPLFNKYAPFKEETVLSKFTQQTSSFVDALVSKTQAVAEDKNNINEAINNNKEVTENKVEKTQSKLFELNDDNEDDEKIDFTSKTAPVNNNIIETPYFSTNTSKQQENILVADDEDETEANTEQLTPSFLNEAYKKQTVADILSNNTGKLLSESINLNDKFIFVRELFGNQFSEYETALKQLDTMQDAIAAENYCNNILWNKFNWTERGSIAARFIDVIKKKFN